MFHGISDGKEAKTLEISGVFPVHNPDVEAENETEPVLESASVKVGWGYGGDAQDELV
jgi:hypothetical protein